MAGCRTRNLKISAALPQELNGKLRQIMQIHGAPSTIFGEKG
ncbi:uncharacterized protein G2W53_000214 [Senna tora]|uniref:Uncharacterized protein n=1 Tax=Senna tora TaxID=362788 RepID=A0A834XDK0_9FABA|nr:uncharacterized protein G2W53_000214 [Senna tora]